MVTCVLAIPHLLFVDDILILCNGDPHEVVVFKIILIIFGKAIGMLINYKKILPSSFKFGRGYCASHTYLLRMKYSMLDKGLKYLGFLLKSNTYRMLDRQWLISKIVKRINYWSHKWLSRDSQLVIIKYILKTIHVYWFSLAYVTRNKSRLQTRSTFLVSTDI